MEGSNRERQRDGRKGIGGRGGWKDRSRDRGGKL
jgi:hypothetical protein